MGIEAIFDIFRFLFRGQGPFFVSWLSKLPWRQQRSDYVIEHASKEVEILDRNGVKMIYRQTFVCRSNVDDLNSISMVINVEGNISAIAADGVLLPPTVARHQGQQFIFKIEKRKQKGQIFTFSIDFDLKQKLKDEDYFESIKKEKCDLLLFRIIFPLDRPPIDWLGSYIVSRPGRDRMPLKARVPPYRTRILGKPAIEWALTNLKEDYYRIDWRW